MGGILIDNGIEQESAAIDEIIKCLNCNMSVRNRRILHAAYETLLDLIPKSVKDELEFKTPDEFVSFIRDADDTPVSVTRTDAFFFQLSN